MKILTILNSILILGLTGAFDLSAQTNDEYLGMLKSNLTEGSLTEQINTCQLIEWSGLTDPSIYNVIEENLLESYQTGGEKLEIERNVWCVKALSFSGNKKYLDTINKITKDAKNKRVRGYAEQSKTELERRVAWNPIINEGLIDYDHSSMLMRFVNMLNSNVPELQRIAAKRIVFDSLRDRNIENSLGQNLRQSMSVKFQKLEIDAAAWMIRAISVNSCLQHTALLSDLALNARAMKIRKYAKKAIAVCDVARSVNNSIIEPVTEG